ncbi:MAG TPA: class I SAM-dependent methyltransferase [Desulfomonilaceae bacterium]|nr:class I SAM-dependent methyltransferase [Desulfomonilaceae bacterium]
MNGFSLDPSVLRDILRHAKPLGHNEKPDNLNLGFGFIYYGVVRALQPKHIVVIGSGYGFSVVCLALGVKDNGVGKLSFIDPSYSLLKDGPFKTVGGTAYWSDPVRVQSHFELFGVADMVRHFKMRSDEFFTTYDDFRLPPIDLAFIDGSHAYDDVKYDFTAVLGRSHKNTYIFLHDTNLYVREALHHAGVKRWMGLIKRDEKAFEVVNFPFSSGVALVRVLEPRVWKEFH